MNRNRILSPVLAAALIAPVSLPAMAQEAEVNVDSPTAQGTTEADTIGVDGDLTPSGDTSSDSMSDAGGSDASSDTNMSSDGSSDSSNATDSGEMTADPLIVTVGDAEITASDIQTAIEAFPPQLAQQVPPEQLLSVAVDQLVLRELILQRAEQENLADDPEVQQMVEENGERSQEDAIVQVYVQRVLDESVSDEAVQSAYDEADSQTEQELPPIDQVRPQIEQQLRQERLGQLRQDLIDQGTVITFYDESGQPVEEGNAGTSNGGSMSTSTDGDASASGSASGSTDGDDMSSDSSSPNGDDASDDSNSSNNGSSQ
ncbi:hypothetical protein [Palleronia sp.]|uniref:hypothetical protein n=1 Tax=Palleronia sp. TaxID=1940284 RepID=UPI0035C7953E